MPGIKGKEESDNDVEMEHDSADSYKSSSLDESTDETDSDDSTEIDEIESDKKRSEYLDDMEDLEEQFTLLREQLYRERSSQIANKLEEVEAGRAREYLEPLDKLQQEMCMRTEVAGVMREYRLSSVKLQVEAETLAAKQNLENEKVLLWDSIKSDLEEKIGKLEEDRSNVDISSYMWAEQVTQRGNSGGEGAKKKPVTVSGPYIIYMLKENEILDDWTTIKKALAANNRKPGLSI